MKKKLEESYSFDDFGDWRHREKIQKFRVLRKLQLHFDRKSTIRTPEQASLPLVSLLFRQSAMSSVGLQAPRCRLTGPRLSGKEVVWSWLFKLLYTGTDKPFLAGNESSSFRIWETFNWSL